MLSAGHREQNGSQRRNDWSFISLSFCTPGTFKLTERLLDRKDPVHWPSSVRSFREEVLRLVEVPLDELDAFELKEHLRLGRGSASSNGEDLVGVGRAGRGSVVGLNKSL